MERTFFRGPSFASHIRPAVLVKAQGNLCPARIDSSDGFHFQGDRLSNGADCYLQSPMVLLQMT